MEEKNPSLKCQIILHSSVESNYKDITRNCFPVMESFGGGFSFLALCLLLTGVAPIAGWRLTPVTVLTENDEWCHYWPSFM